MDIFFISFGVWEYDGRLRELIRIAQNLGHVNGMIRSVTHESLNIDDVQVSHDNYVKFVFKTISLGLKMNNDDILFVDNRKAVIPAIILKILKKPIVIQDVRELYLYDEQTSLSSRVGTYFERKLMKKATITIVANEYRSDYMFENFKLRERPIVFENIRRLASSENNEDFEVKYREFFDRESIVIITTSGTTISRTNDILADAFTRLDKKFKIVFVGNSSQNDTMKIHRILSKTDENRYLIIGSVSQDELQYLISKSKIGIVNYHSNDKNNLYCASGKLYEFIFEGIPVVTTNNPPLLKIIEEYRVGVSDNRYFDGINTIANNYQDYSDNVNKFKNKLDVDYNNTVLIEKIKDRLD